MIYHYVNLVTLRPLLNLYNNSEFDMRLVEMNVDSLSLQFFMRCFGVKRKRISGIEKALELKKEIKNKNIAPGDILFILPNSVMKNEVPCAVVAPILDSANVSEFTKQLQCQAKHYKMIIIGIGGPMHDALGLKLAQNFPEKDIICLGAALDVMFAKKSCNMAKINSLGLNFVYFMITDPKRFIKKIKLTAHELIRVYNHFSVDTLKRYFDEK